MPERNGKLKTLSLKEKYEIIRKVNNGEIKNKTKLAEEIGIKRTTLSSICANSDKIIADYEAGGNSNSKRKRKHSFEDVDKYLLKWFKCVRDQKISISGEMLLLKGQEFAKEIGYENYKNLDMSWISRWKAREEVVCKKLHGEADSVDQQGADDWQRNRLPLLLKEYKAENIFNTDETGLFFKCLPERTHVFKAEKCAGGKMSKERVTVLVTASMTGEKLPLFVIGKYANPRCFKGVKKLPVSYDSNTKAWMTSVLFEKWLRNLEFRMRKEERKIALVLDNCSSHPDINGLKHVKLVFLPPNTTAKTQPMDAGVIRCLKFYYRKNLAEMRLLAFEQQSEFKVDLLNALQILEKAWNSVSDKVIQNCFKKVKFMEQDEQTEVDDAEYEEAEETWKRLKDSGLVSPTVGFAEYSAADAQVVIRETVSETSILEEIRENSMTHSEEANDDPEEDSEAPLPPSTKEALDMVKQLQLYMMCHETKDEDFSGVLHKMNSYLVKQLLAKTKQSTILDYFGQK